MFEQYIEEGQDASAGTAALERHLSNGANWFYWIAGLSVVNSLVNFFEGQWNFAVGLGVTQILDGFSIFAAEDGMGVSVRAVFLGLSLACAGIFFMFGSLSNRRFMWAMSIGTVVYMLDGLILLLAGDILGIIVHVIALYFLVRGLLALRQLRRSVPDLQ